MYAMVTRRQHDPERQQAVQRRADAELWPTLRQAPGFVAAYVIRGDDGMTTAIALWEDRAQMEAFRSTAAAWAATMEESGRPRYLTSGEIHIN